MAKVILLVRVSTTKQEIETQKNELISLAMSDGYTLNDMVIIEGVGASAIKLNDVYLQEIEELFTTIENDKKINACYAWEISRLGRNEEMLIRIKNFLISHKVQLVIKNPSLRLLNNDGSVNNGIELAFSLFSTMAKQEMQLKKERFARAKARNKAEGKFNGGRMKLGYCLDANKHFIIDEEKAQLVRNIFQWYLDGQSQKKIFNKLTDMGIYQGSEKFNTRGAKVAYLLKDRSYIGENGYPQIIDEETFNKVQDQITNKKKPHTSKNIYFCKSILKDALTGTTFTSKVSSLTYVNKNKQNPMTLNMNALDCIALYCANIFLAHQLSNEAQNNKEEYKLKIEENNSQIKTKQKQIKDYKAAIDRAIEMNIMQPVHFPKEKMEAIIKRNETAIKSLEQSIVDLQTENTRMNDWLNGKKTFINQIKREYSDEKKKEIIDSLIHRIEVTKIEYHHYKIVVKNKTGYLHNFTFDYQTTGHKIYVEQIISEDNKMDMTPTISKYKHFGRARYEK